MNIFDFMAAQPFLTWCLAWGIWPIYWLLEAPFKYAFKAYNRKKRSENILAHGWPTAQFMDADGDIIHPPKDSN